MKEDGVIFSLNLPMHLSDLQAYKVEEFEDKPETRYLIAILSHMA